MLYKERNHEKGVVYLHKLPHLVKEKVSNALIYLNESGIYQGMHRPYGKALCGKKIYGNISSKKFAHESFVTALCNKKIIAPMVSKEPTLHVPV